MGSKAFGAKTNPQWELMRMWEEELMRTGAARPGNIAGADELSCLYWFMTDLCHWYFVDKRWLAGRTEEQMEETRKAQEEILDRYLAGWGY